MGHFELSENSRNLLTGGFVSWIDDNEDLVSGVDISNLSLSWRDLSVWREKKIDRGLWQPPKYTDIQILYDVSGEAAAGNLIAIMGARGTYVSNGDMPSRVLLNYEFKVKIKPSFTQNSGSGKTSLLAAISRRDKSEMAGKVMLNGKEVDRELMAKLSGFVPQKDMVIEDLTVAQHMEFMARLMMDRRCKRNERRKRIDQLLSSLNLRQCRNTLLQALSGGEKKKVALAAQLLNDPPVLFCDEATTGLDSWAASAIILMLRKLASTGKIIICSIHQPASGVFEMFHQVIFLSAGRLAFHGTTDECKQLFDSLDLKCPLDFNRAEYYVKNLAVQNGKEIECNVRILKICGEFRKMKNQGNDSYDRRKLVTRDSYDNDQAVFFERFFTLERVGSLTQFYWLLWRNYISTKTKYSIILAEFVVYMVIAVICSIPYADALSVINQETIQNLQGLLYLMVTETVFLFIYSVWITFPSEIPVLLRESANGLYGLTPYYFSKTVLWIPRSVILPTIFSSVVFLWVGLKGGLQVWLMTTLVLVLTANFANAYGAVLSAAFENFATATLVSVNFETIWLVFSGVMISLVSVPIPLIYLKYISPVYYGTEGISILQWDLISNISCNDSFMNCITSGQGVLRKYGYSDNNFYWNVSALVVLYIFLHIIAYIMVCRRSKRAPVF